MKKDFIYGINLHHAGYESYPGEDLEKNLDECVEMGLNWVRINCSFGSEDDADYYQGVAKAVHEKGLKLMHCVDIAYHGVETNLCESYFEKHYQWIGETMKGQVDIYQIFNEMDVTAMHNDIGNIVNAGSDGLVKEDYDPVRWERALLSVKGAIRGLKKGDPNAKICVNFSWRHTALIYAMIDSGCEFDVIGFDWYSDCENAYPFLVQLEEISKRYPNHELMICETNFWMNCHNPKDPRYAMLLDQKQRDRNQAEWVVEFTKKLFHLPNPNFKGIFYYELMDEPAFERNAGHYHGESHFGFINCDDKGKNRERKPVFDAVKQMIEELSLETEN